MGKNFFLLMAMIALSACNPAPEPVDPTSPPTTETPTQPCSRDNSNCEQP